MAKKKPGLLIRGSDNTLYFIPDGDLKRYKLPPQGQPRMDKRVQAQLAIRNEVDFMPRL